MMELAASRTRNAEAVVVEARLVVGQGAVATIIAKRGVLRAGQPVVVGSEWGKVPLSPSSPHLYDHQHCFLWFWPVSGFSLSVLCAFLAA